MDREELRAIADAVMRANAVATHARAAYHAAIVAFGAARDELELTRVAEERAQAEVALCCARLASVLAANERP